MRQSATAVFGLGVAIITFGITRYNTFRKFAPPSNEGEGDDRYIIALQHMLVSVLVGVVLLLLSCYFLSRLEGKLDARPVHWRKPLLTASQLKSVVNAMLKGWHSTRLSPSLKTGQAGALETLARLL